MTFSGLTWSSDVTDVSVSTASLCSISHAASTVQHCSHAGTAHAVCFLNTQQQQGSQAGIVYNVPSSCYPEGTSSLIQRNNVTLMPLPGTFVHSGADCLRLVQ